VPSNIKIKLSLAIVALAASVVGAVPSAAAPPPAWTVQTSPNWAVQQALFRDVSCASSTACMAVGDKAKPLYFAGIAQRFDGSSWHATTVPNVPKRPFARLDGVSCTAANACTAVGSAATQKAYGTYGWSTEIADVWRPTVMRWNGTSWALQSTPSLSGKAQAHLFGVSCTSATFCTAVGQRGTSALIESWNGMSWSVQTPGVPVGPITSFSLADVSCTSTTSCIAVGSYGVLSDSRALAASQG
jgi:hypothetical protein